MVGLPANVGNLSPNVMFPPLVPSVTEVPPATTTLVDETTWSCTGLALGNVPVVSPVSIVPALLATMIDNFADPHSVMLPTARPTNATSNCTAPTNVAGFPPTGHTGIVAVYVVGTTPAVDVPVRI